MAINSSINISYSVGLGGRNHKMDVRTVQTRLNELMDNSRPHLKVDGISGSKTHGMIADFQESVLNFKWPDSRIDPNGKTLKAMNSPLSAIIWQATPATKLITSKRKTVNLHFRSISLTTVSFDAQFKAAVQVFDQYKINIKMKSGKSVWLSETDRKKFKRVNTSCVAGKDEWSVLQKLLNDVPSLDICVFFVGQLWDPKETPGSEMFLGCGAHRPGSPACAVAANASKYDMAHEVAHVLGLGHNNTKGNLMHPTQARYSKLPHLTATQLKTIRKSVMCR